MEIEGIVKVIKDEHQVSEKFKKREIVVTTEETYPQHILIEFSQDKCNLVDNRNVGDRVKVSVNISGREWADPKTGEVRYFNSIKGWKIELLNQGSTPVATPAPAQAAPVPAVVEGEDSDLPF
jgi:hypothetical protein